ncbi:MAG TPA: adenylate/guanylate cyclase domain-containing protein, partial [Acetobacteraceae bacterium]|nr:adenylate/guanylate cyclase domain-containing protein [Acetobacteraceae bacterium]
MTVMFCDLVESTPLASRLDPEELAETIGAYRRCVADAAARFDGFVAQHSGDGVLAYFGYPHAHEDDAERAVRAALAVVDSVERLLPRRDDALRVRIGIASGLAVVGDIAGGRTAPEWDVAGEVPSLAARLQAVAGPNRIVVAPGTRKLIGTLFRLRDLGAVALKGFSEPVRAWEVLGAR